MSYIVDGFVEAFGLLISFDNEIYSILGLSIIVSITSTILASIIGIFLGILIGLNEFPLKKILVRIIYSFMALPPVVVGLFVAITISRRGPLGSLGLIFTPTAMIIAQTILIIPIVTGLIFNATNENGEKIREISISLGASNRDRFFLVISELKKTIAMAITTGFGRGISEVGAVMIVGGNIKGHTRVMTTFIAMNNSMGNYSKSIAMGLVLITISVITNSVIHRISGDKI